MGILARIIIPIRTSEMPEMQPPNKPTSSVQQNIMLLPWVTPNFPIHLEYFNGLTQVVFGPMCRVSSISRYRTTVSSFVCVSHEGSSLPCTRYQRLRQRYDSTWWPLAARPGDCNLNFAVPSIERSPYRRFPGRRGLAGLSGRLVLRVGGEVSFFRSFSAKLGTGSLLSTFE